MSLLLVRPSTGTGVVDTPTLALPVIHARIGWRTGALTLLDWSGTTTSGWTIDGSGPSSTATSLATTASDSFGGGSSLQLVTAGTADSGADWAFTDTFVSGREYRFRVGLRSVSGNTTAVLRFGNASDYATSTATMTTAWAWYTADWTPSADRTDASVSVQGDAITARIDHAEVYEAAEDVSVESLRVTRGRRFDGFRDVPGTIDLTILDPNDVYTPRNSSSSLYGTIDPGAPLHVRATYGGRLYALAYGRVRSITPDAFSKKVTISADDGLKELDGYTVARPFAMDMAAYEVRAAVLADEALPATMHDLATDSVEASPVIDGTDQRESVLDYLDDLNDATGTVHYCKPHVEAIRPWRYTTVTRTTLTNDDSGTSLGDDFQRITGPDIREESYVTRQRVSWRGYDQRPSQVVAEVTTTAPFWVYTDELYGSSEPPEDGDIFAVRRVPNETPRSRRNRHVRWGDEFVDIVSLALADGDTRTLVVDFKVPMEDIAVAHTDTNGYVTSSVSAEPARATITLTCSGGADDVTNITLTAKPRIPRDEETELADTAGANAVREGGEVRADRLQSGGQAGGMADYITWRYGHGRLKPTVVDQHNPGRQFGLDVGSHVTLTASRWFIASDRYVVSSIEHDLSDGGAEWEVSYGLDELPAASGDGDWVMVDGSSADGIDSSAVLAH